jgi:hypothetical protein
VGFTRRPPIDPGRARQALEYTDAEIAEVIAALRADAPELLDVLEREAKAPGGVAAADYDDVYDRMLTYLFEHGYVHTHIEMAMVFRGVRERVGKDTPDSIGT